MLQIGSVKKMAHKILFLIVTFFSIYLGELQLKDILILMYLALFFFITSNSHAVFFCLLPTCKISNMKKTDSNYEFGVVL